MEYFNEGTIFQTNTNRIIEEQQDECTQLNIFGCKNQMKNFGEISKSQFLLSTMSQSFVEQPLIATPQTPEMICPPPTKNKDAIIEEIPSIQFVSREWNLSRFELGRPLGSGKFGHVYLAREIETKYPVALKILSKKQLIQSDLTMNLVRELEIHSRLHHDNVVKFFGYFWDDRKVYLILEYAPDGALWDYMKKKQHGRFSEQQAAVYIKQVAQALQYLHSMNIIHRDIKPENLLVFADVYLFIKLSDFGWSVHTPSDKRKTYCGTPDYLCPEMIDGMSHDHRVDNWTLGVLTYELTTGRPPFESKDMQEQQKKIKKLIMRYPPYLSEEVQNFIEGLLQVDRNKRMTLQQALQHPWIIQNTQ